MAPKRNAQTARSVSPIPPTPKSTTTTTSTSTTSTTPTIPTSLLPASLKSNAGAGPGPSTTSQSSSTSGAGVQNWDKIVQNVLAQYVETTPQRTKLLDAFLGFLVVVGGVQFVYCVVAGNYPFNAFLSGFSATVGQFVLTASLRIQTTEANKGDFPAVSPERAFADYVVCSLILHFFCVNFIN
ncbi:DAD family protein [Chaetomium sp. MPI-SDFR-AT-0129]|nr:DAD family protein [Chaetomium sp. MPI-SDFR-AT-0129]